MKTSVMQLYTAFLFFFHHVIRHSLFRKSLSSAPAPMPFPDSSRAAYLFPLKRTAAHTP